MKPWQDETLAANGVPIRENFANWFGASRVMTEEGLPMVMYRGQRRISPTTGFDLKWRACASFTNDPSVASLYAGKNESFNGLSPHVLPVYLSISKPLDLRDYGNNPMSLADAFWMVSIHQDYETMDQILRGLAHQYDKLPFRYEAPGGMSLEEAHESLEDMEAEEADDFFARIEVDPFALADSRHFVRAAMEAGFDGIVIRDVVTEKHALEIGLLNEDRGYDTYRPFQPSQVKSAIGNSGLYLKESNCVTDQLAARQLQMAAQARREVADHQKGFAPCP